MQNRFFFGLTLAAISASLLFSSCDKSGNDPDDPQKPSYTHNSPIEGCLPGLFAVSPTTQVYFSQGNLQYHRSRFDEEWRFAENQYDLISEADNIESTGNVAVVFDLFGWGTGNVPQKREQDSDKYAEFHEWGDNAIVNGGNQKKQWRTLSAAEWMYLFHERPNAEKLFGHGTIDLGSEEMAGIILLPDNWEEVKPEGTKFFSCVDAQMIWEQDEYYTKAITYTYLDEDEHYNYMNNIYPLSEWQQMEEAGAVFLPAAGYRCKNNSGENEINDWNSYGYYWASTSLDKYDAHELCFGYALLIPNSYTDPYYGESVRLIRKEKKFK